MAPVGGGKALDCRRPPGKPLGLSGPFPMLPPGSQTLLTFCTCLESFPLGFLEAFPL